MSKLIPVLGAVILIVAVVGGPRAQEASGPSCGDCHDEIAASFHLTPHAADRDDAPRCQSCHGDGTEHIDEGGDPALITVPRGAEGAKVCLTCHAGARGEHSAFAAGDVHARAGVTCDSCHKVHHEGAPPAKLLAGGDAGKGTVASTARSSIERSIELCARCHPRQERTFSRPFGHRLGTAGLACVSCHDPHGGPGARSLKVDRSGESVCVSCHADRRGPFVFPHLSGAAGDCVTCHDPHGSSNPNALHRSRADQLCLECHSTITAGHLGAQPPASHDLRTSRFQSCTVCHVAIHGSNTSPTLRK